MNIGEVIKEWRILRGMTQNEFAEKLYVTRQTISNWKRQISPPSREMIEKIAEVLEIELTELVNQDVKLYTEDIKIDLKLILRILKMVWISYNAILFIIFVTTVFIIMIYNMGIFALPYAIVAYSAPVLSFSGFLLLLNTLWTLFYFLLMIIYKKVKLRFEKF